MSIRQIPRPWLALALLALSGCATVAEDLHEEGMALFEQGKWEDAVTRLEQAAVLEPRNITIRRDAVTMRDQAINRLLIGATSAETTRRFEEAETLYNRVLRIDPRNARALAGLKGIAAHRRHIQKLGQARESMQQNDLEAAQATVRAVLLENPNLNEARTLQREIDEHIARRAALMPTLKPANLLPFSLEFRDAQLKLVFDAVARLAGLNFIFDKDVKLDARTTVFLRQVNAEEAIDMLLITNQLEKKILNETTLLIYPNIATKQRDYQDLVIRSFHLGNADPKQVMNMLKTILKTKDMFVDEKVNLLVMRDTPDIIRLAEKLIAAQDLPEPEVTLEVDVMEVATSKLTELGLKFPTTLSGPGGTLEQATDISSTTVNVNSGLILNLKKEDGNTNLLASPRIRVRNREKARVHIGDRVPVISATVTPSTGTPVVTEQIQYVDVGIKLDVEPSVHLNDDVGIRIGLEVSTFQRLPPTSLGTQAIQVSTRNANTTLRLRDNETQVLTGLISDAVTKTVTKVPIIGDIPALGRLFSNNLDDKRNTELVMLITPRVVRNIRRPELAVAELWSGTEASVKASLPIRALPAAVSAAKAESLPRALDKAPTNGAAPVATEQTARLAPPPAARAAVEPIQLSWNAPPAPRVGEEFTVTLIAKSAAPVLRASVQLRFDPAALEIVAVDEGDFFKQGNAATTFSHTENQAVGRVSTNLARSSAEGASGEGKLVTLRFKAKREQAKSAIHLLNVASRGVGDTVMPVRASGPLELSLVAAP